MSYLLSFFISFPIGFLTISLLFPKDKRMNLDLHFFLAMGLGLGISGNITFYSLVLFEQLNKNFVIFSNLSLLALLVVIKLSQFKTNKHPIFDIQRPSMRGFLIALAFAVAAIPLIKYANFYLYGGWDAWAIWNLKAKFLFEGGTSWQNIFDPRIMYTQVHHPLMLPLINVWGWILLKAPLEIVPLTTSVVFSLLTVGLLFSSLRMFIKDTPAFVAALALLTLPKFLLESAAQYSDIILAYFLLGSCICFLTGKSKNQESFMFLSGLFLGFLGFTKPEGFVAVIIITTIIIADLLLLRMKRKFIPRLLLPNFLTGLLIASLPTIIFNLVYSPGNQGFISGLVSTSDPSTFYRMRIILSFFCLQLINAKWHGIWILLLGGLFLSKGRCFSKKILIFPLFLMLYGLAISFYYFINTNYEIKWWLSSSLTRIFLSVMPITMFWTFLSFFWDQGLSVDTEKIGGKLKRK